MRTANRIRLGIGLLLALQLGTSLAAVGLLARISPGVDEVLRDNVASLEAVERMLAALQSGNEREFDAAFRVARSNVTERQEGEVVRGIDRHRVAAFKTGGADAAAVTAELLELSRINREPIQSAGEAAERLGSAGAWVMVLLGLAGFAASFVIVQRIERRVFDPLAEIAAVLDAALGGDPLRRCGKVRGAAELTGMCRSVDRLLDERMRLRGGAEVTREARTRTALRELLDRMPDPVAVVDPEGELLAAGETVREALLGRHADEWREALRAEEHPKIASREPLPEGAGFLVRFAEGA